jgi:hypothetical protein
MAETTTDAKVKDLIALVTKKRRDIARDERPSYNTRMTFSYHEEEPGNNLINLHTVDAAKLQSIAGFLILRSQCHAAGGALLGIDSAEFKWQGFTVDEWMHDLGVRYRKVMIGKEKEKLATLEARLSAIISPELRAQMEIDAITNELG